MATNVGSIEYDARINTSMMRSDAARAEGYAKSLGNKFSAAGSAITSSAKAISLGMLAAGTATVLLGKSLVDSAAGLEITAQSFRILIGDAEKANKLFGQIKQFADSTPFEFPELAKAATTLLGYGITAEKVNDRLKRLGDAAAATGGDLGRITLAYAQMVGRGKVTGDNLRQLTENMVTLREELSQVSGVPMQELDKAIESGEISVEELNAALDLATDKGGKFFNGTNTLAQTFSGRISTLKDGLLEMGRNLLGVKVDPQLGLVVQEGGVFDRLSKFVADLNKNLPKIQEAIRSAFSFIAEYGKPIAIFVGTILTTAFISWAAAVVSSTWPILALAAAFTGLYMLFQKYRPQIQAFWDSFMEKVNLVRAMFETAFMPSLRALGNTIMTSLLPVFGQLWASIKRVWDAINPAFINGLKILGAIIGAALVAAIWIAINVLNVMTKVWGYVGKAAAIYIGWISNVIKWIGNVIVASVRFAGSMVSAWNTAKQAVGSAVSWMINKSSEIIAWFQALPGKIVSYLGDLGSKLYNSGAQAIQGFIDGITSKIESVKSTLSSLTNMLPDWKGPLSVDKVLLKNNGQAIIDGFVKGMESRYGVVQSSLSGLTSDLSIGARSIGNIESTPAATSNITVNVNMSGIMARSKADEREIAKSLIERVNEELRAKQLPELGGGNI